MITNDLSDDLSQEMMDCGDTRTTRTRDVLGPIFLRHGAKWLRYAQSVLGNQDDAEDVIQEAMKRVLARDLLFASEDDVKMYLGRAISNMTIEFYHSKRRARNRRLQFWDYCMSHLDNETPQALLERRESVAMRIRLKHMLRAALMQMPAKQYEALRLTVLDASDVSIREAGAASGIAYSTLRHRSLEGIRKLRKFMHRALQSAPTKYRAM